MNNDKYHIRKLQKIEKHTMPHNTTNITITPVIGLWPEEGCFWLSDSSEFTITAPIEGIISFQVAIPKIKIHSQALPLSITISLNDDTKCSREMRTFGSFRVQCSAGKGEKIKFKIICSNFIIPDDILHNRDNRKLSVILRNFTITKRAPILADEPLAIDYLVYSSHKTATQSVVASLKSHNGHKSTFFCHRIDDPSLMMLFDQVVTTKLFIIDLQLLVDSIYASTHRKLQIISIYREPGNRLISSFFQSRGNDDIKYEGKLKHDTVIYKLRHQPHALQNHFNKLLLNDLLEGYYESMNIIFNDLNIQHNSLTYNPEKMVIKITDKKYDLFLIRFDILISRFKQVLSHICGKNINICSVNLSEEKWYADIHKLFKQDYQFPKEVEEKIRRDKLPLHKIFYGNQPF